MMRRFIRTAVRFRFQSVVHLIVLGVLIAGSGCVRIRQTPAVGGSEKHDCLMRWDAAGNRLAATVPGGLVLLDVRSGERHRFVLPAVTAFDWLPGSDELLVSTATKDGCRLWRARMAGDPVLWRELAGACRSLVADETGVWVLTERLSQFTFGGNLRLALTRIDAAGISDSVLADLTLSPAMARRLAVLRQQARWSALSPQRDILLYAEPHDPPAMAPYLRFMARHLVSGASWPIVSLPWTVETVRFSPDGETVELRERSGPWRRFDLWTGEEQKAGTVFPAAATETGKSGICSSFSPDGKFLAARQQGKIMLAPKVPDAGRLPDLQDTRRLELRRWRSRGLIDGEDYRTFLERIDRL
ncbi:hypothetical protein EDC39_102185 [Geothermobacter ehrlichii]|uniref:WD40 repeat protein n=1 Tax=Geothermobacter ehrlichii TaxID=213224 RepID=A0A5D3WQA6_9BACT|nr:hypothetical protein [Geothermobacter ehrlichii]TYO99660.1 hypothetical protein EDC39_102185 [Geothermobacter ehrlichii]